MATTTDPAPEALRELDELTAAFKSADEKLDTAREALHEALIRHRRERSARPSDIAEH